MIIPLLLLVFSGCQGSDTENRSAKIEIQSTENRTVIPKDEGEIDPDDDSQPSRPLRVVRVVDGDTILVIEDGEETKVRLIGIDTPELATDECLATGAKAYLEELVENHTIVLLADDSQGYLDKYARKLGYLKRDDGLFVNMELIIQGFAREYTYRTPYFYQHAFRLAQAYASNNNLGIWNRSVCNR